MNESNELFYYDYVQKKAEEKVNQERLLYVRRLWEHDGIRFMLIEHVWSESIKFSGYGLDDYYCGYCNLDVELPYDVAELEVNVHGGVTLQRDERDGTHTYGFDCVHAFDEQNPLLRDEEYLVAQCESMAQQIIELGKKYAEPKSLPDSSEAN